MNPSSHPPAPCLSYRLMQSMMWPVMKIMGLSCRHFAALSSLRLDRSLTLSETLRFHAHRIVCTLCRPLPKQLEHLRALTRCTACESAPTPEATLDDDALTRIRSALEEATNNKPTPPSA